MAFFIPHLEGQNEGQDALENKTLAFALISVSHKDASQSTTDQGSVSYNNKINPQEKIIIVFTLFFEKYAKPPR